MLQPRSSIFFFQEAVKKLATTGFWLVLELSYAGKLVSRGRLFMGICILTGGAPVQKSDITLCGRLSKMVLKKYMEKKHFKGSPESTHPF